MTLDLHYRFDTGTVTDYSGNGRTGTLNGSITTGVTGQFNDGININADGQYVSVPITGMDYTGDHSYSVWVNPSESYPPTENFHVMGIWGTGGSKSLIYMNDSTTGAVFTLITANNQYDSNTALTAGSWNHVVAVWDDTNDEVRLYLDGNLDATFTGVTESPPTSTQDLEIGGNSENSTQTHAGDYDEARAYGRALTDAEVTELYNKNTLTDVSTNAASNVGATSTDLNGNIDDLTDESDVDAYFEYRQTGASTWQTTTAQNISATGTYTDSVTGLTGGTQYEYRAVMDETSSGTRLTEGSTTTFTTTSSNETVTTNSSSNVQSSSADLTGEVTDLGTSSSVEAGFQYRTVGSSTWTETTKQTISTVGTYTQNVSGLSQNTDYEFRAEIEDGTGTQLDTGSTLTFTTLDGLSNIAPADNLTQASRSIDFQYNVDKASSGTVELVVDGNVEATHTTPANTTFTDTVSDLDRDNTSKNWNVDFYLDGSSTPDDSTTVQSFTIRSLGVSQSSTQNFMSTMTTWGTSLSQSEIHRFELDAGEELTVQELQVNELGGGTENTNFNVEVYDATNTTVLETCNLNQNKDSGAISGSGATILIRITNSTGSAVDASFNIDAQIQ